jgi:hypothetical protein
LEEVLDLNPPNLEEVLDLNPPNLEEVLDLNRSFKNNKALGIDMIPIELIKTGELSYLLEYTTSLLRFGKKK